MAVPTFALWKSLEAAFQGARQLISAQTSRLYWPAAQPGAAMPLAVANMVNLASSWSPPRPLLRSAPPSARLVGLRRVTIGYPLLFPATSMPLMSMPRFVLAAFPLFMSYGALHRAPPPGGTI